MNAPQAMIEIVSATRLEEAEFWANAALAHSLRRLSDPRISSSIAFSNSRGLPEIYNEAMDGPSRADVLVFMHDDVWIDDYYFVERIMSGLSQFDVIGLAGNKSRREGQRAWSFVVDPGTRDDPQHLSGRIAQAEHPGGRIFYYGPAPARCELLDGVLLAARKSVLRARDVRFDREFPFHFYDMDFCRTATEKGLRLGTWPICVTHQSRGGFSSDAWNLACTKYFQKWGT